MPGRSSFQIARAFPSVAQYPSLGAPHPNCAKRLDCTELAPAAALPRPYDSASKLDALHTLRGAGGISSVSALHLLQSAQGSVRR